ncbi:hypothetical protein BDZ89DRAFT_1051752 [Hymenopellis radicata]|nr:hypothetical protein BDZ89DRAFT_1051752 [Hymenopellis radicata]
MWAYAQLDEAARDVESRLGLTSQWKKYVVYRVLSKDGSSQESSSGLLSPLEIDDAVEGLEVGLEYERRVGTFNTEDRDLPYNSILAHREPGTLQRKWPQERFHVFDPESIIEHEQMKEKGLPVYQIGLTATCPKRNLPQFKRVRGSSRLRYRTEDLSIDPTVVSCAFTTREALLGSAMVKENGRPPGRFNDGYENDGFGVNGALDNRQYDSGRFGRKTRRVKRRVENEEC